MTVAVSQPASAGQRSVRRRVVSSIATQLVARVAEMGAVAVTSVLLLRHLGPSSYGDFVLVVAVASLPGLLSEFGLSKLAVRNVSRTPRSEDEVIGTVIVVRLVLALVALLVAQAALGAFGARPALRMATAVAGAQYVAEAVMTVSVAFHVRVRQQYEAAARLVGALAKLVAVVAAAATGAGLVVFVAATVAPVFLTAGLMAVLRRRVLGGSYRFARSQAWPLLREALPVGPAMLIGVLYLKLDALLVGLLDDRRGLGIYGAAYQPIEYAFLASALVVQVLFPLLSSAHGHDRHEFQRIYRRGTELLVAGALFVGMVAAIAAVPLVDLAYRQQYREAAPAFTILALALVLLVVNAWQGFVLLAAGQQQIELGYLLIGVGVNVVADVILIRSFGFVGAAWGTLLSASVLVGLSNAAVRRCVRVRLAPKRLAHTALCAATGAAAGVGLRRIDVPWPVAVALGSGVYAAGLVRGGLLRLSIPRPQVVTP
jgi:O-antigen/teichoic acid export membrane protein